MAHSKQCCSVDGGGDASIDTELHDILNALFCMCLDELQSKDALLQRDLFRLTELEGQTLDAAAQALGIGIPEADEMLTQTRRDVAVAMVIGLGKPTKGQTRGGTPVDECDC